MIPIKLDVGRDLPVIGYVICAAKATFIEPAERRLPCRHLACQRIAVVERVFSNSSATVRGLVVPSYDWSVLNPVLSRAEK